jgi:hypothetical protein
VGSTPNSTPTWCCLVRVGTYGPRQLARRQHSLEHAAEEIIGCDFPRIGHDGCAEREHGGRIIGGRIVVGTPTPAIKNLVSYAGMSVTRGTKITELCCGASEHVSGAPPRHGTTGGLRCLFSGRTRRQGRISQGRSSSGSLGRDRSMACFPVCKPSRSHLGCGSDRTGPSPASPAA